MAWAAVLSMAIFHLPLLLNKKIKFYKLMGTGKGGSFSKSPDWLQWSILITIETNNLNIENPNLHFGNFILKYLSIFSNASKIFVLQPYLSHGTWDGKKIFENCVKENKNNGAIAVLTRATIRINKLKQFWKYVPIVNEQIKKTNGLNESYGIGEIPFIKQATLSIWENEEAIKNFAYKQQTHKNVVELTRKQDWYKEEMFTRFYVIKVLN